VFSGKVYVCACDREREREREMKEFVWEGESVCECMCAYVCVSVCVCKRECVLVWGRDARQNIFPLNLKVPKTRWNKQTIYRDVIKRKKGVHTFRSVSENPVVSRQFIKDACLMQKQ